jgi:hypothetical protein
MHDRRKTITHDDQVFAPKEENNIPTELLQMMPLLSFLLGCYVYMLFDILS